MTTEIIDELIRVELKIKGVLEKESELNDSELKELHILIERKQQLIEIERLLVTHEQEALNNVLVVHKSIIEGIFNSVDNTFNKETAIKIKEVVISEISRLVEVNSEKERNLVLE